LNWVENGAKIEDLPWPTRGLLLRFINGFDKFLEQDST
jgi:hypothetical protein